MLFFFRRPPPGLADPGVLGEISLSPPSSIPEIASTGVCPPDNGLGGRLVILPPLGGCGNALMLIAFRIDFPAPLTPGVISFEAPELVRSLGRAVLLADGVRNPLGGREGVGGTPADANMDDDGVGIPPVLFLDFAVGIAGRAVFGGPRDGLGGLGIVVVMTLVEV